MAITNTTLVRQLYKEVILQKIKEDNRYCKAEVLSDCLDAVAYFYAQIGKKSTKDMYQEMYDKHCRKP